MKKFLRDAVLAVVGGFVIEPTLHQLRFDIAPYLPQVWFVILWFVIIDALIRTEKVRSRAIRLYSSFSKKRKMSSYFIAGIIGFCAAVTTWAAINGVFKKDVGDMLTPTPVPSPTATPQLPPSPSPLVSPSAQPIESPLPMSSHAQRVHQQGMSKEEKARIDRALNYKPKR